MKTDEILRKRQKETEEEKKLRSILPTYGSNQKDAIESIRKGKELQSLHVEATKKA
jgi:hypothetical protein